MHMGAEAERDRPTGGGGVPKAPSWAPGRGEIQTKDSGLAAQSPSHYAIPAVW